MADDRWRRDERYYREPVFRDDETTRSRHGDSFYSGRAADARGYGGYGGGGGDVRSGRFSERTRRYEGRTEGPGGYDDRAAYEGRPARPYEGEWGYPNDPTEGDVGRDRGYGFFGSPGRSFWRDPGDDVRERSERFERGHRGRGPRGYARSAERIREDVSDRLTDDPYVDASDIEIKVSGTEVTLTGTVDSREARRRAEDLAERVVGVTHVQNNLRVRQPGAF
ncbi:MAG TPA: BON domain-containing protein [Beijerinckiaceae bacterium]|nr:BON domain-containing protein [Beijerinckiaceae bacterium]